MGYTLSTKIIEPRAPEMLVRTGASDDSGPYNQVAPGLYPDETLYEIDDAGTAAISVETRRLENNGGLAITGWARAIEDDGSTRLDGHGAPLETSHCHTADWGQVASLGATTAEGQAVLERELLLAVMGQPGGTLPADAEQGLDERPILQIDRAAASIVQAVAAAASAGSGDPTALIPASAELATAQIGN